MLAKSSILATLASASGYSFVSIGDWGGVNLGGYHEVAEKTVAAQMEKTMAEIDAKMVLNVGDNFYYCGVNGTDDPLFKTDFEDVFTHNSTMVPWYSTLGNHDYGYSPEAQIKYTSPNSNRWVMPSRYYLKRFPLSSSKFMSVVFLDTNPCISAYRSSDPSGWDPCSGKYMDCPGCKFHENILAEDCSAQLSWLEDTMKGIDQNDWVLIVGHHPAYEMDVEDLTSVIQKYGFDLYLNGHTHELNTYSVDDKGAYLTTGAGTMVAIPKEGGHDDEPVSSPSTTHSHQSQWWSKVAGFTTHSFNSDFTTLTTNFVAYNGTVVKSLVVHK
eukprot:TRINITY_DN37_c6_g1_i1.p1 TRINITY_DN37_c6_g1~~TRINITY_DN37_c6_g1_i1.p1  ORF type:complete len:348 (+),score=64.98 TRINITY_DN37_c6_g1_i1:65-1045(+)